MADNPAARSGVLRAFLKVNIFIMCRGALGACLAVVYGRATAAGGPPFITDDPEPVELGHYEFYIASYYFHTGYGALGTLPHVEFNYGAAPNLQLHIIAPMAFYQANGGPMYYGYGQTELGAKYRFLQEGKVTPMAGVFPLVETTTADAAHGLGNAATQVFLPVWLQKSSGSWSTYGGAGYWYDPGPGNQNYWFMGWQAQNQVTKQLAIGAEVFHSTSAQTVDGSAQTGFNVGAVYDFDDGHHVMLSVGRGFDGTNSGTGYFAYQWTWGPRQKEKKT